MATHSTHPMYLKYMTIWSVKEETIMKIEYIVNGKSIALNDKIEKAILNGSIPLSLFRATLLNAVRKILNGREKDIDYTALSNAIIKSIDQFKSRVRRLSKLVRYANDCLMKIKNALENRTEENLGLLRTTTGYLPAKSIKNYRFLMTVLKRRIFDLQEINELERIVGGLNSIHGSLPNEQRHFVPGNKDQFPTPQGERKIPLGLLRRHNSERLSKQMLSLLCKNGKQTLTDLGFDLRSREMTEDGKYYVYHFTFKNITIPCKAAVIIPKEGKENENRDTSNSA